MFPLSVSVQRLYGCVMGRTVSLSTAEASLRSHFADDAVIFAETVEALVASLDVLSKVLESIIACILDKDKDLV